MTSPRIAQNAPQRFTGWHMLAIMIVFFGGVIAVNLAMARLALATFSGEVVANSYVASQHFNGWLDQARAERALGWAVRAQTNGDDLVVTVIDRAGHPVTGARLGGDATHPLGAATDRALRFGETGPGRYSAALPAGRWQINLLIEAQGHSLHHRAAVTAGAAR